MDQGGDTDANHRQRQGRGLLTQLGPFLPHAGRRLQGCEDHDAEADRKQVGMAVSGTIRSQHRRQNEALF